MAQLKNARVGKAATGKAAATGSKKSGSKSELKVAAPPAPMTARQRAQRGGVGRVTAARGGSARRVGR